MTSAMWEEHTVATGMWEQSLAFRNASGAVF